MNDTIKSPAPAIGIDLGTTYSCVAICKNDKVTIIPNSLGTSTTPSYIAFDDKNRVTVGEVAKTQANLKPANTIYDVKRLIGRSFDDPIVQKDIKLWPFNVVNDNGTPKITVNDKSYYAEVISAKLLTHLKKQAEEFLGCPVKDAVITVPAYFNDGQRQATKDAGSIAGLNVLRIINEPTAAAIAYCHQVRPSKKKNILVFDLGGGTFDIAVLTMDNNKITVLAVGGDTHLGGEDFDVAMADHCIKAFEKENDLNLADGKDSEDSLAKFKATKFLRRLKNECEHQKINLVGANRVTVSLESVTNELDLSVKFTRSLFDALNNDLFEKCIKIIDQVLSDINMVKGDIDEIVMVGGSSKILRIQQMVQEYFGGKQLSKTIKPDEAVAYGAAVQAASMAYDEYSNVNNEENYDRNKSKITEAEAAAERKRIKISDVIPLPVGIRVYVEEGNETDFSIILDKNSAVPSTRTKLFSTPIDNCKELDISVYEGESRSVSLNHMLGRFVLQNLPPHCRRGERIDVTMEVNEEGILHVNAECPATKSSGAITVNEFKGRLTPDEIINLQMEELFVSSPLSVDM